AQKYVAPEDIASVVYPLINHTPAGITVKYAFSDTFTGDQFVNMNYDNLTGLTWLLSVQPDFMLTCSVT
ncbi:hypothetical protein WP50_23195, partial [Lactiplantibacillus plantarum]